MWTIGELLELENCLTPYELKETCDDEEISCIAENPARLRIGSLSNIFVKIPILKESQKFKNASYRAKESLRILYSNYLSNLSRRV